MAGDETIQKLPNDMILEIVPRLPLKYAIRCRTLNKYFYNNISIPKLLSSTNPPIIFRESYKPHNFTIISSPLQKSTTLHDGVSIIDSRNGILLLRRHNQPTKYYLFNPLTGGIKILNCDIIHPWLCDDDMMDDSWDCEGLAITVPTNPSSSCFDFKLVELQALHYWAGGHYTYLRFRVHVPSSHSNNLANKIFDSNYHGQFAASQQHGVYAHGCVHWLEEDAEDIVAFDVETERPRVMDGPLATTAGTTCFRTWFGLAQGSLQFIRDTKRNVIVHIHNYATLEWCVAHKIPKISLPKHPGAPVFFDGRNVYLHIRKKKSRRNFENVYVHDLSTSEWNRSGQVEGGLSESYMEFVPTTARVSDVYLSSSSSEISAELRSTLDGLQRILLDHA